MFRYDCLHIAAAILKDASAAEDAVHEAFLSVFKKRGKYLSLPRSDFRRAIVIITRNKCFDMLKKKKRVSEYPPDDRIFEREGGEPGVEEHVIRREEADGINRYLDQLDGISRQILYMKYILGMTYKEIGASLDMKEKTVEVRIARAKAKLREKMREGGEPNGPSA